MGVSRKRTRADNVRVFSLAMPSRLCSVLALLLVACAPGTARAASRTGAVVPVSPVCSLYAVTLVASLMTQMNSPTVKVDPTKWPSFLVELRNAKRAFVDPRLGPVEPRYESLARELRIVGGKLIAGDRKAALAELRVAAPDVSAINAQARRRNVVCKSGSTILRFG